MYMKFGMGSVVLRVAQSLKNGVLARQYLPPLICVNEHWEMVTSLSKTSCTSIRVQFVWS